MTNRATPVVAGLIILGVTASVSWGHSGATGVVKERMEVMKDMKAATKDLVAMAKGEVPFAPEPATEKARLLANITRDLPQLFPADSLRAPSEAAPAVWTDRDGFVAAAEQAANRADALVDAIPQGRAAFAAALSEAAKSCKSCHETYRVED